MKIKIVKLTPESFAEMLQGKQSKLASSFPTDIEVLDIKMDLFSKQVLVAIRSESFEDVPENMPTPEFAPSKIEDLKITSRSVTSNKPHASPELTSSVAKLPIPQPSRMASKMENEFSPEQRKLLNFNVKDDCVVVKPVTFLKTEWEDINEVVRSLGGKWVKGDIISYWEIPLQ
jgi:hypothetical protein